ncbi:Uncharacterised protein [Yersinia pseudotuberculosis]|nr:Uncharacterised protein [Yersinia pseudotuberculosis]VEG86051.1 Uncharacterised protein [Yersinia pseudotuberculosis]
MGTVLAGTGMLYLQQITGAVIVVAAGVVDKLVAVVQ